VEASRARIAAAADETRRRIERDLHDGAQQRLVSLGLELHGAAALAPPELAELRARLARISTDLAEILEDLRRLAQGIHPAVLTEAGLEPALRTLARRCPLPVELDLDVPRRVPERIAVASYYLVSEALTNAAKHSQATVVHVRAEVRDRAVVLGVCDDGLGGADPAKGTGLVGLVDRVEVLGGVIAVSSARGQGTTIRATLPIAA
jgi:signal transduction histidine kinase